MDGPPPGWPFAAATHSRDGPVHRWSVAITGEGPDLLLLHGTGASAMSFRGLAPLLAPHYRLCIPDLPGHGFTTLGRRGRSGLVPMAEDLAALLAAEGVQPQAILGHSAGAAIALRLAETLPVRAVVGINAALGHFEGAAGLAFPVMAKVLATLPFVPSLFSWSSSDRQIATLLASTGSPLDPEGRALYRTLVARPSHVDGALAMMAEWKLDPLLDRLPGIATPTLLLTGSRDGAVPPRVSARAAARLPQAEHHDIIGYGHLIHEEAPEAIAPLITGFLAAQLR